MKNFKITKLLAIFIAIVIASCSSDDGEVVFTGPSQTLVQASFTYSISSTNPNVILLNNTTQGQGEFTSEWDFGDGEAYTMDEPGLEEVSYSQPGQYEVRLIVTNTAGFTVASQTIRVDENGICPNSVCGGGGTDPSSLKGAANGFSVGTIVRDNRLTGMHDEVIRRDFNNITSEYQMKMNIMYPSEGTYDFGPSDAIVDYGVANGIDVHGHALIWHNATPNWVENFSGTDAEFEDMVRDYIRTVLERYRGKVRSWDVVNEAIEDGSNELRNSVFRQRMGDDFIEKCYQMARDVDPDVLLFYNDYNMASDSGKRAAMFEIADRLKALDLIDGIGAQLHISYNGPARSEIQAVVNGTVSRDLLMHFAEIDIRTNPEGNTSVTSLSSERALLQKDKYKELAEIYTDIPQANKFAFTVWGLKDNESWLLDFWGVPDFPLLFDANFDPKPAYEGVLEGFQ